MKNNTPPFNITPAILTSVAEIAELVGKISSTRHLTSNPTLRRNNRIRTIHGSLAIEQNTLTMEQVTAVLNGKQVLAPPKDIAEVKNAYEIYEYLDKLNPYSVEDLLRAHGVMMRDLVEEAGEFRSRPVGVVDSEGNILHFGTLPAYVPGLVKELMEWTENSDLPMLIKSCVFHYELELIHPFADGNGRMGRLWHTLLLSKWNPLFAWLPVESIIHDRQQEYYDAINASNNLGESTPFLTFMLSAIQSSLMEAVNMSDDMMDEMSDEPSTAGDSRWNKVKHYLQSHSDIQNAMLCEMFAISPATANRLLRAWVQEEKLEKFRNGRSWAYRLKK